jgi:hypothetical protein
VTTSTQFHISVLHWARSCALGALLLGCVTEPSPVRGAWSLTASYGGGDFTCTVLAKLTLDGSGSSYPGTFAEEHVDCTNAGTPLTITPDTLSVFATIQGRTISFTPQSLDGESGCAVLNFEGQVVDDRISGMVRTRPVFCQGTYLEMKGTWQAQRMTIAVGRLLPNNRMQLAGASLLRNVR